MTYSISSFNFWGTSPRPGLCHGPLSLKPTVFYPVKICLVPPFFYSPKRYIAYVAKTLIRKRWRNELKHRQQQSSLPIHFQKKLVFQRLRFEPFDWLKTVRLLANWTLFGDHRYPLSSHSETRTLLANSIRTSISCAMTSATAVNLATVKKAFVKFIWAWPSFMLTDWLNDFVWL